MMTREQGPRLVTNLDTVTVPAANVRKGDRMRAGAVGLATVKKVHLLHRNGKVLILLGKPGWVAGRTHTYDSADTPVTVRRPATYIRFTTDDDRVQVLDLTDPDSEFDADTHDTYDRDGNVTKTEVTGRYATLCTEHSTIVTHDTLALARAHAVDHDGWCLNTDRQD